MKLTNYFFIFAVIFSSLFLLLVYTTNVNVKMDEEDQKYRDYLYEAAQSALQEVVDDVDNSDNDISLLWSEENRNIAYKKLLSQFNMLLDYPLNSDYMDTTEYLFPVICYIDQDGFYLTYVGVDGDQTADNKRVTTPINTWTTTIDGYNIRYYLGNDILTVTDSTGKTQTGTYDDIDTVFNNPSFLSDRDGFNHNKNEFIVIETEKQLNYYINNKDTSVNQNGKSYTLSLDISNDEMHKMFTESGIAIFMQGPSVSNSYDYVTIFGYAHHQIKKTSSFPVTVDGINVYYHKDKNCPEVNDDTYIGTIYSKKDAAENGISECPTCFVK